MGMKTEHPTILVVGDNATDQRLIQMAFRSIGVTDPIHYVDSGKKAIAYMMGEGEFGDRARFAYPTFVLTDLYMENGDGFDVLEFLKTNPEWAIIPTIVLSRSAG